MNFIILAKIDHSLPKLMLQKFYSKMYILILDWRFTISNKEYLALVHTIKSDNKIVSIVDIRLTW